MNCRKGQKNDYVFVAHNGSAYDSQFIYKNAHDFFGSRNVQVLMHNNRMIELKIQVNTGFRMSAVYFKDSYKFINLPLHLLSKSFRFSNDLQKGFDDFVPLVSKYCSGISQYRVGDYYLDGFRELPGGCREFYEFYGYYYHSCDVCYMDRSRVVRCKSQEKGLHNC